MTDQGHASREASGRLGGMLHKIALALALLGGFLACLMGVVVTVSVTGRYLFAAPIPGDYDIVGILCGSAVFAFLPYCQLKRANVIVDFFTARAPPQVRATLDATGTALYLAAAILLTWRLYHGALDLHASSEVIAAFNFYRWWTMPFDILCMVVLILVIAETLMRDVRQAIGARRDRPIE